MGPLDNHAGISLTEVLVAMAAGTVILSTTFQAFTLFESRLSVQQETMSEHQDQRLGLHVLEEELRLAGTGSPQNVPAIVTIGPREIEFTANVEGLTTVLTQAVSALQQELPVLHGSNWNQGKRIVICSVDHCVESRLAFDGRLTSLSLIAPLGQSFPAGSEVFISNRLRYYVASSGAKQNLMRQVDGGTNTIIENVTRFQLAYLDRNGKQAGDAGSVARVRVELAVAQDRQVVTTEIGLRGL